MYKRVILLSLADHNRNPITTKGKTGFPTMTVYIIYTARRSVQCKIDPDNGRRHVHILVRFGLLKSEYVCTQVNRWWPHPILAIHNSADPRRPENILV